jgi:hypothetical protein
MTSKPVGVKSILASVLLLVGGTLLDAVSADAAPVVWPVNGHSYELINSGPIDWTSANIAAIAMGGHLATIRSSAENDFAFSLVNDVNLWLPQHGLQVSGPWLGGYRASADNLDWHWVTNEPFDYSNWEINQPDNGSPGVNGEDALHFFAYGFQPEPTWNDAPHETTVGLAYLVEWELAPEPAALVVVLLAATSAFACARLRN